MIDGARRIPTQTRSTTQTRTTTQPTTTTQPRVTAPVLRRVRTAPKIYWFQGKSYTSLSAYQAAVSAAKTAAAAQQRAKLLAQQRVLAERRAAQLRAEQRRRADAYRPAAVRAVQRASDRETSKAIERRVAAAAQEQARRAAARRRAVSQELLRPIQRRDPAALRLLAQQRELREVQADREARARTQAFDRLQDLSRRAFGRHLLAEDRQAYSPQAQRRLLVEEAQTTGNWTRIIGELSRQSRQSGGAFVDDELMRAVQEGYVAPIQGVRDQMAELVAEMNRLEKAGDMEELLDLVEDPDNQALYREFLRLFGDGTRAGAFTPIQEELERISRAREEAWAIQLGMGRRYASPEQARQLVEQARRESRGRLAGTGVRRGEQFVDIFHETEILNPDTGRMERVTLRGLDAWLAKEQAREARRIEGVWQARQSELARWNQHMNPAEARIQTQTVRSWLPEWELDEQGVPVRISAMAGNPGQQENLIREFMSDASNAYDRHMGWFRGMLSPNGIDTWGAVAGQRYLAAKKVWLAGLARQLGKQDWGTLEQLSTTGLGFAANTALTAFSIFPALIRNRLQQDFGNFQPHLEVPLPWDPGSQFQVGRSADPNADAARSALATAGTTGDFWNDLGAWASVIRDNSMWGSGNIGGAFTQLTDPFLLAGPGRFVQAGKLATARAGGVAGIRSGNVGLLAREFARYTAPEFLGGAGRGVVKVELAKLELARGLGLSGTDALRLGDDEFRELIEKARLNRTDELLRSDTLARLTEASGIEKTQILNMVQEMAPKILREFGIFAEDPFEAASRIVAIRRSATRARSEAESAVQLARMQTERKAAMEALSRVTGRPLAPAQVTPARLARHEELVRGYSESAQEYLKIAERGVKAAEQLEAGVAHARQIRTLQAQLRTAVREIAKFEDTYAVDRHGRRFLQQRGLVGRRFDQLQQYRGGVDPTAPSFIDQSWQQLRFDERRVKGLIRQTLRQLKATPVNQQLSSTLKAQLRELELARRGLVYERALLDEGRTLMRPYVRKNLSRVERSVTPQRIAPLAANDAQLARGVGQDFMRALDEVNVRQPMKIAEAKMTAFRAEMAGPVDVTAIMGAHAKRMGDALGRNPTLGELWTALHMASRDGVWAAELAGPIRRVNGMVYLAAKRSGMNVRGMSLRKVVDRLFEVMRDDHIRLGQQAPDFSAYKSLDKEVEEALVDWRKFQAEGQIRLRERRFKPASDPVDAVFHDRDPFEVLVKQRVLEQRGISVFAYDELRGVLRRSMLRENAGKAILERAQFRAAREGIPLEEAVRVERKEAAQREVIRNVEEFSTRPELRGLPPETRLRAFEERMMLDDLPVASDIQYSEFQIQAMRNAFEELLGFSIDDKHMIARYFRGELDELPAGARRPHEGEFMVFEGAEGVNVNVVPRNHPKLAGAPFGGRPRGELDDDLMKMLAEIDDDLARQADDAPVDDLPQKKPWLREEGAELSEAATERRGAAAGKRQNPAAESRRSTRRNFADPRISKSGVVRRANRTYGFHEKAAEMVPDWKANRDLWFDARGSVFDDPAGGVSPTVYRQWLWDRIQADPAFRSRLKNLRGKNLVHRSGVKAQILADASDWLWTDDAAKLFDRPDTHLDLLRSRSTPESRRAAELGAKVDEKAKELREARKLAGEEFQVFVPRKWLDDVVRYIEQERATIDAYYHSTGDRRDLSDALEFIEELREGGSARGVIAAAGQLRKLDKYLEFQAPRTPATRASSARRAKAPVEFRGVDPMGTPPPETFSSMLERKFISGKWEQVGEVSDRKAAEVSRLTHELAALRAEARAARKAVPRARQAVGMSIHGDGVYVAEGTSNVTVAHELFHQFWDNDFNTAWRGEIEDAINMMDPALRTHLWNRIRIGTAAFDEAEFAAELFALWRVGDAAGSDVFFDWAGLRSLYQGDELRALDELGRIFSSHAPRVVDTVRPLLQYPPLQHRGMLMKWMEEQGFFSPRTAEQIRTGERVWSVDEERRLIRSMWGAEPAWTDATVLRAVLDDPRLHAIMLREWGFFDDDFEQAAADLTPQQLKEALVWGREGFERQRTYVEMRDWAIQRYGEIVSEDGHNLTRMPWLMRPDDEYLQWTKDFFSDTVGHQADLLAARDRLPETVRKHLFDGDAVSRAGMEIDPSLVKGKELAKLQDAITHATRRRIQRLIKSRDTAPGDWLAQEQLRFAYDVTDQLLADPVWRGWLRGTPVAGAVLRIWGQLWRLLVSWQPAFPIMNLIDSYGMKRLLLTVFEGGMRPLSLEREGRQLVPSLRTIGAESQSIFHLSGGSPWVRAADGNFTPFQRGKAVAQGMKELPVRISMYGEDHLRLDFARRVAGDTYRSALATGMSVDNAGWLARMEAKRMVEAWFAMSRGRGWETALNELIPFFSYNFKTKTLALQMIWNHPAVWAWGQRLQREIEASNREQWERDHPGLEFPGGASASWLWWKVGDDYYKIDLSAFSDWTRAMGSVMQPHTPFEWLTEFLRVPHPSQLGALAMFTGGQTPWGNPGHIREMSMWADLFYWLRGVDYADPRKQRDGIQMMSQILFFKEFGKIGPMQIKQATFFALDAVDKDLAREYLEANPDLQIYWDSLPERPDVEGFGTRTPGFRRLLTKAEEAEYDSAIGAFEALNGRLDASIARWAAQPWSDGYREAKRNAHIARTIFLRDNPILTDVWGSFMTPADFAEFRQKAVVDHLADAWFNWKRPAKEGFDSDLAYQRALVDFNARRAAFLEAHPALAERLQQGRTAIENAWKDQELHWTEILDFQARLKIRILEEEARGDDADPDVIDLLYRARDFAGADLDADQFGMFGSPGRVGRSMFSSLPGFADIRYARATPEERKEMKRDEWYFRALKDISSKAKDGKHWYEMARANPAFLQEYWRRNPEKKAEYDANQEYIRWIGSWARNLEARNFSAAQGVWGTMPAWVKERYFAKHPDSKMRDGMGGGGTAVQYKGRWFKSPESRDRYIKFIENGGDADGFVEADGQFFRSAESRQRFLDGQAYFASISRWVDLLKAKEFEAADKHFRAMPAWMQEKYYAKHPEQRARAQLDSDALRRGAEYFLATGDDKLRVLAQNPQLRTWLNANGGDEAAMRGLINAMYRAIPSSEPWLKRTFRERFPEVFGEEAAGDRRIEKVARELAEHPEMVPFFERALKLQSQLFFEQLKRNKVPPKPWTMERKQRLKKKGKRRAARLHSRWTLHRDIRKYAGAA